MRSGSDTSPASAGQRSRPAFASCDERVRRALRYPYERPDHDYLYWRGRAFPLPEALPGTPLARRLETLLHDAGLPAELAELLDTHEDEGLAGLGRRHGVLACGSNQSPERLAQKFGTRLAQAVIPVTRVVVREHAVFHAAVITRYGAVPATIAPCPGARAEIFVTWLTDAQLAIMNETEDLDEIYELASLPGEFVVPSGGDFRFYRAIAGLFAPEGRPVALAAVPQSLPGRVPVADESEMLAALHRLVGRADEPDFAGFVVRLVEDDAFRRTCERELAGRFAVPDARTPNAAS